jgi:hypothetical protein
MALVLAETVAGSLFLLFLTPLWNEVKPGFFKLTGAILLVLALATWGSIASAVLPGSTAGLWAKWMSLAVTIAILAWVGLLFGRVPRFARVVGFASLPLAAGMIAALAGTGSASYGLALAQLVAGSMFLGAVLDGLLLGHWYLTDRGLSRAPINRYALLLLIAVVFEAVAVIAGGFGSSSETATFNPLLTAAGLGPWIAIGMVVVTAMIAVMIRLTLKGERASAVQAATGFFYLAVVTAFAAELATKVRFLPGT